MRGRLESSKGKFECLALKGTKANSLSRQVKSIGDSQTSVSWSQSIHFFRTCFYLVTTNTTFNIFGISSTTRPFSRTT